MAVLYINARSKRLLNILLGQSDYISLNNLAQELAISRRTVYYDIAAICANYRCKSDCWVK